MKLRASCKSLARADERVRGLRLSRNFGQQIATTAGLEHAAGDAVVVMDADLQDPPELIETMLERWREGYHVAYAQRTERTGENAFKLWSAKVFYRLVQRISHSPIPADTGDFRLMDRQVVDAFLRMPERDRFLRGMVGWVGYRQIAVPYKREARFAGTTNYPLAKMVSFAIDGILSFSFAPLRLAVWTGFVVHRAGAPRNYLRCPVAFLCRSLAVGSWLGFFLCRHSLHGRRAVDFARHHRRIRGPDLRRGETTPALPGLGTIRFP